MKENTNNNNSNTNTNQNKFAVLRADAALPAQDPKP